MGTLKHISSGRTVALAGHSAIGRDLRCVVRLVDAAASNEHASVSWNGERWEARDLGSTNGTWVDRKALSPKERRALSRGSVLRFGSDAETWELSEEHGPVVVAYSLTTDEVLSADSGLLVLPNRDDVVLSIVEDASGHWFVETSDGSRRPARDGEKVFIGDRAWELRVPPASPSAGTYKARPSLSLASLLLRFHVSLDGEHIRVDISDGDLEVSLGERAIFDVLLVLARERLKDTEEARLPEEECGWYELQPLTREVSANEQGINLKICRLRELFGRFGVEGAGEIVERRPRQLRIGTRRLEVIET